MDYAVFCEFRHALANATSIDGIKTLCGDLCRYIELEKFYFAIFEMGTLVSPKMVTLSNFPQKFLDEYSSKKLANKDPTLQYCFSHETSIVWSELLRKNDLSSRDCLDFFEIIYSNNLKVGLSIPIRSSSGQSAILSFASSRDDISESSLGDILITAEIFSRYLLDAYIRIDRIENPKVHDLTERELECVFWACEGKTAWEMAQIVGITERTINFHLTSVIKKLGASNRQHAVAKAVLYGIVKPRP